MHMSIGNDRVGTPLDHGLLLHGSGEGLVAIAQKYRGAWNEKVFRVDELPNVLPAYAGQEDVFISQNRFYGWRGVARITELSAMYADLDYYRRPELANMHVRGVFKEALEKLESARLPQPSFAVATGRGLALVWLHTPISKAALARWSLCQSYIWRTLRPLEADRAATDAARVLRLVGSINSKSGVPVEMVWADTEAVWDFEALAYEILPEGSDDARRSQAREQSSPRTKGINYRRQQEGPAQGFSVTSLNQARLEDLHRLMDLRGWEMLPPGRRDSWLLIAASCLSRLVRPEFLEREVCRLAKEVAGWNRSETKLRMQPVFKKAEEAESGGQVLWEGSWKDPRYEFTNQRIIENLDITPAEERELKTIISEHTRRRRDRARKERDRRKQGAKPRKEYLAEVKKKRKRAKRLRDKGYSNAEIARRIGCSARHVSRLLNQ